MMGKVVKTKPVQMGLDLFGGTYSGGSCPGILQCGEFDLSRPPLAGSKRFLFTLDLPVVIGDENLGNVPEQEANDGEGTWSV